MDACSRTLLTEISVWLTNFLEQYGFPHERFPYFPQEDTVILIGKLWHILDWLRKQKSIFLSLKILCKWMQIATKMENETLALYWLLLQSLVCLDVLYKLKRCGGVYNIYITHLYYLYILSKFSKAGFLWCIIGLYPQLSPYKLGVPVSVGVPHWHVTCQPAGLSKCRNDAVLNKRGKISWLIENSFAVLHMELCFDEKWFLYRYKLYW